MLSVYSWEACMLSLSNQMHISRLFLPLYGLYNRACDFPHFTVYENDVSKSTSIRAKWYIADTGTGNQLIFC